MTNNCFESKLPLTQWKTIFEKKRELMIRIINKFQAFLDFTGKMDFLGPLALRLYLAPIMWMAGTQKLNSFSDTVTWFGDPDWGLGLPFPALMAALVTGTEVIGAVFLLLGFAVRWISIPLFITMVVAAITVHWQNGWVAIAEGSGVLPLSAPKQQQKNYLGPMKYFRNMVIMTG
jgi:uncharacterized membrane protein YphA (DoxX/SURF4 family)